MVLPRSQGVNFQNVLKSLKVIKITTFDQNQVMTCYLISNFRPSNFSYFGKITAISISHNVKKLGDQKWSFPVVKGLKWSERPSPRESVKNGRNRAHGLNCKIFFASELIFFEWFKFLKLQITNNNIFFVFLSTLNFTYKW